MNYSDKLLKLFPWFTPPTEKATPIWESNLFHFSSGKKSCILEYEKSESQWSEELTLLHEVEAGNGTHSIDVASRQLTIDTFQKYLSRSGAIILDIGCSSGFLLKEMQEAFPDDGIIGADYITGPLKRLEKHLRGIPLLQFDARNSPLPDACVDGISCLNVLEHIDDDCQTLSEIYRMLKPGGIAHIEVPAAPSCYDIYDEHLMHHRRYKMSQLSKMCQEVGFKILEKTHLGFFLFPVFYIIKQRNRRLLSASAEIKAEKVKQMMHRTSQSALMKIATQLEFLLRKLISFPVGIRCVLILQK